MRRISVEQEDQIWALRCQGLLISDIAQRLGVSDSSVATAIRRVIRRRGAAVRYQRWRCFLSDAQVQEIRQRRAAGEPLKSIAKDFQVTSEAIGQICRRITYADVPDQEPPRTLRFPNRLMAS